MYAHMISTSCLHTLELVKQRYIDIENPMYTATEIQELEAKLQNNLPTGSTLPNVPFATLLKETPISISTNEDMTMFITHEVLLIFHEEFQVLDILATLLLHSTSRMAPS